MNVDLFLRYSFDTFDTAFLPRRNVTTNIIKNNTNKIFAIPIDAPAIPVNPSTPAIKANTKNIRDHLNIMFPPQCLLTLNITLNSKKSNIYVIIIVIIYKKIYNHLNKNKYKKCIIAD
jgi:hypothetical protein